MQLKEMKLNFLNEAPGVFDTLAAAARSHITKPAHHQEGERWLVND